MPFAVEKRLLCILNLYTCGILKLIKNVNHCKNTKNCDLTISCAILRRNWYSFWQAPKNLRMPTGKKIQIYGLSVAISYRYNHCNLLEWIVGRNYFNHKKQIHFLKITASSLIFIYGIIDLEERMKRAQ